MGRYLRTDPLGLDGGVNLYSFALNNPLRFTDPDGLIARDAWTGISGAFNGAIDAGSNINSQINNGVNAHYNRNAQNETKHIRINCYNISA